MTLSHMVQHYHEHKHRQKDDPYIDETILELLVENRIEHVHNLWQHMKDINPKENKDDFLITLAECIEYYQKHLVVPIDPKSRENPRKTVINALICCGPELTNTKTPSKAKLIFATTLYALTSDELTYIVAENIELLHTIITCNNNLLMHEQPNDIQKISMETARLLKQDIAIKINELEVELEQLQVTDLKGPTEVKSVYNAFEQLLNKNRAIDLEKRIQDLKSHFKLLKPPLKESQ